MYILKCNILLYLNVATYIPGKIEMVKIFYSVFKTVTFPLRLRSKSKVHWQRRVERKKLTPLSFLAGLQVVNAFFSPLFARASTSTMKKRVTGLCYVTTWVRLIITCKGIIVKTDILSTMYNSLYVEVCKFHGLIVGLFLLATGIR